MEIRMAPEIELTPAACERLIELGLIAPGVDTIN
jgi:hypothetical protein